MLRRLSVFLAVAIVGIAVCIAVLDRPLALWGQTAFVGTPLLAIADAILRPLAPLLGVGFGLAAAGAALRLSGREISPLMVRVVNAAIAIMITLGLAIFLKIAFGRSQVGLFLEQHVFAFDPFRLGKGYTAFPSATMSGAAACLMSWRPTKLVEGLAGWFVLIVVAAALIVTNGHWLSDIVGGGVLGVAVAAAAPRIAVAMPTAVVADPD